MVITKKQTDFRNNEYNIIIIRYLNWVKYEINYGNELKSRIYELKIKIK